jgi:D-glycero-D-manno-heptose 1,7-bisphosphate phosphatase
MKRPLVLLDRDGVINEDIEPHGVVTPEAFRFIPEALGAIKMLHQAGFAIAIITNQSAVGKELMTLETLGTIHDMMLQEIRAFGGDIDAIYSCHDHPDHATHRRKPNAGMLEEALRDFKADAATTPMVGDALRDMQAAYTMGCPRILVRTGKGQHVLEKNSIEGLQPVTICANVREAATHILTHFLPSRHA